MKFLDCTVRITQTYSVLERALHEKHLRLTALPVEAVKAYCKNILYIQPNLLTSAMELRQTATKLHGHIKAQDLDSNFSLPRSHALLQNSIFENTIHIALALETFHAFLQRVLFRYIVIAIFSGVKILSS